MAHMLAIKLYTGNMVDCQLPEYKWSLSDFQKLSWSSTRFCETQRPRHPKRSLRRGIPPDGLPRKGRAVRAHLPEGKALLCNTSRGTAPSCVSGLSHPAHPRGEQVFTSFGLEFQSTPSKPRSWSFLLSSWLHAPLPSVGSQDTSQLQTQNKSLPSSYLL